MPELYIITGSNGAGKSTIGSYYLPEYIRSQNVVFDGDKLFMEKQRDLWRSGMRAYKETRKLAFEFVCLTLLQPG
jgi:predicted ABC-type ATPase